MKSHTFDCCLFDIDLIHDNNSVLGFNITCVLQVYHADMIVIATVSNIM